MRLLAGRAAAIEGRAEAARLEAAERRDAAVADARADLKAQQEAFAVHVAGMADEAKDGWQSVKDSLRSTKDRMRAKVEKGRSQSGSARRRGDRRMGRGLRL